MLHHDGDLRTFFRKKLFDDLKFVSCVARASATLLLGVVAHNRMVLAAFVGGVACIGALSLLHAVVGQAPYLLPTEQHEALMILYEAIRRCSEALLQSDRKMTISSKVVLSPIRDALDSTLPLRVQLNTLLTSTAPPMVSRACEPDQMIAHASSSCWLTFFWFFSNSGLTGQITLGFIPSQIGRFTALTVLCDRAIGLCC